MTDFFMEKFEEEIYVEIPEAVQHEQLSEAIRLLTARKKLAELNKALQTKKAASTITFILFLIYY